MIPSMAIGRAERFAARKPRVTAVFGSEDDTVRAAAQVLELMEMAWHDCYAEISPAEEIVDNVLLCSGGTLRGLIAAAHLAVIDRRDLEVWAADLRRRPSV
jgi:uncharacterized tellurite resistance protein B-like protein